MKLLTAEFAKTMAKYPRRSQENERDPLVVAKFFDPCGSANWYILEFDPVTKTAFCYVTGLGTDEFGYASIAELEEIKRPHGLTIERDLYFTPEVLSTLKPKSKND